MELQAEIKKAIDDIQTSFEAFKVENDKSVKKGIKDALAEAKLEALSQSIDDLTGKKDDLERRMKAEADLREELERKVNKLRLGGGAVDEQDQKALGDFNIEVKSIARARGQAIPADIDMEGFKAYKKAFATMMRKGDRSLSQDEHKAMQVGVDSDGGFLVPTDTSGRIVTRVYDLSPIRQIASVQAISSDKLEGINDLDEADSGWVGEIADRNDTDTPEVAKYDIEAKEIYAQPKASQRILDDAAIDIEAWLSGKVADRFARQEGQAFIAGNVPTRPRGFTTYTTAATADSARAWGVLEHINTGLSSDFASSNPADVLFDIEGAFKPHFLNNARWVTRRSVLTKIRKFKESTTNGYLWQPGLQAGQPQTLIGYPIVRAEDMPTLASGSLSLGFGDFKEGYQIVDRLGIRVLRDPYTAKPYVRFYSIKRVGGGVTNFEAIKFVRFGT